MSMGGFAGDALRQQVIIDVQAGDGGLIDALEQKLRNLKATADTTTEMWREGSISADMYTQMIGQTGKAIDKTIAQLGALKNAQQADAQSITDQARAMWAAQRSFDAVNDALELMAQHEATAQVATDHLTRKVEVLATTQGKNTGSNDVASQGMIHLSRTMYFASQAADDLQYSFCLKRGSLIQKADDGLAPIEDIKAGDTVVSLLASGRLGNQIIRASVFSGIKAIRRLSTDTGQSVECSGNHPILTPHGWIAAENFQVGDLVAIPEAESIRWVPIASIEHLGDHPTHDLQLFGEPNFIAGGIVVHNSAIVNNLPLIAMEGARAAGSFGLIKGSAAELNMLGMQVGAAVALIGVGINTVLIPAVKNWIDTTPGMKEWFGVINEWMNPFHVEPYVQAIGKLHERLKELEGKKFKVGVDYAEIDITKQKIKEMEDGLRAFDAFMKHHTEEEVKAGEYLKKVMASTEGKSAVTEVARALTTEGLAGSSRLQEKRKEIREAEADLQFRGQQLAFMPGGALIIDRLKNDINRLKGEAQGIEAEIAKNARGQAGTLAEEAYKGGQPEQERLITEIGKVNPALAAKLKADRERGLAGQPSVAEEAKKTQKEEEDIKEKTQQKAVKDRDAAIAAQAQMFAKAEGGTRALGPGFTVESVARDLAAAKQDALVKYAKKIRDDAIAIAKGAVEKEQLELGVGATPAAAVAELQAKHEDTLQRKADADKRRIEAAQNRAARPSEKLAQQYRPAFDEEMLQRIFESRALGKSEEFIRPRMAKILEDRMRAAGEQGELAGQAAQVLADQFLEKARVAVTKQGPDARANAEWLARQAAIKRAHQREQAQVVSDRAENVMMGTLPTGEQRLQRQVAQEGRRTTGEAARAQKDFQQAAIAQNFMGMVGASESQAETMAKRTLNLTEQGMSLQRASFTAYREMTQKLFALERQMQQIQMHMFHGMHRQNTQRGNFWPGNFPTF